MAEYFAWNNRAKRQFFGQVEASAEYLQRPWPDDARPDQIIETSYFGFSIPEEDINGEIYFWFHPTRSLASGGAIIQRGRVKGPPFADFCEWRDYMAMPDDITDCVYENGIRVKMTKPQQQWQIGFTDPITDSALELQLDAVMPVAVRPGNKHVCQVMKTSGTLRLRGHDYRIDGFTTRDRSWGDPRPETSQPIPPLTWAVPVFDASLAFHVTAFDTPELVPGMAAAFPDLTGGRNLLWGYVWEDGRLLGVKACQNVTTRDPSDGITPVALEMVITDELDRVHKLSGVMRSMVEMCPWPNTYVPMGLVEWTYEGRTGFGDLMAPSYPQRLAQRPISIRHRS